MNDADNFEMPYCAICGDVVHKLKSPKEAVCDICGEKKPIELYCDSSHYICFDCAKLDSFDSIKKICLNYHGIDPIALAVEIMNYPGVRMKGAEHHFIAPAALLTCIFNKENRRSELPEGLETIHFRALNETPQECSFNLNTCGASLGVGVFLSVYLNRNLNDEEGWNLSNEITAAALHNIAANPGARCCKRDTYLSLFAAIDYLKDKFAIELPKSEAKCVFSLRNRSCGRESCMFYNIGFSIA